MTGKVEDVLREVFGAIGYGNMSRDFGSVDFERAYIKLPGVDEIEVLYEVVPDYPETKEPLTRGSLVEFTEEIRRCAVGRALLISERPIEFVNDEWETVEDQRVAFFHEPDSGGWLHLDGIDLVVVDLSDDSSKETALARIKAARQLFETAPVH